MREANVYFLPPLPAAAAPPRPASRWSRLATRFRSARWRVRFALAGVRVALRRPAQPVFTDPEPGCALVAQRAELIERRPPVSPARVIDFRSARARLRPLAAEP
jgi:hypothetical protein